MSAQIPTIRRVAKALGDDTRLRLVDLLLGHELCGRAIAVRLGVSEAAVSQHLRVLKQAGLVEAERRGRFRHYRVKRAVLEHAARALSAWGTAAAARIPCPVTGIAAAPPKRKEKAMCCRSCCEHPERLKDTPASCTPEQIRECHGEKGGHPCTTPPPAAATEPGREPGA